MAGTSVIEINRSALAHNLQFIQNYFGEEVKLSSVIKANAYGHGIEQFVPIAETAGINHFSVFSGDEAKRVYEIKHNCIYKWITNRGVTPELRHTACSAAAMTSPKTRMDMIRLGILQYGFWPSPETFIHFVHKRLEKTNPQPVKLRTTSPFASEYSEKSY